MAGVLEVGLDGNDPSAGILDTEGVLSFTIDEANLHWIPDKDLDFADLSEAQAGAIGMMTKRVERVDNLRLVIGIVALGCCTGRNKARITGLALYNKED